MAYLGASASFSGPGCWGFGAGPPVPFRAQSIRVDRPASAGAGADETVTAGTWGRRVDLEATVRTDAPGSFHDAVTGWATASLARTGFPSSPAWNLAPLANAPWTFPHGAFAAAGPPGSGSLVEHDSGLSPAGGDPRCLTHHSDSGLPTSLPEARLCLVADIPRVPL